MPRDEGAYLEILAANELCPLQRDTTIGENTVIATILILDDLGATTGHAFDTLRAIIVDQPSAFGDVTIHKPD